MNVLPGIDVLTMALGVNADPRRCKRLGVAKDGHEGAVLPSRTCAQRHRYEDPALCLRAPARRVRLRARQLWWVRRVCWSWSPTDGVA
jgi:hypothetical protein